jgi:hypothetical protein
MGTVSWTRGAGPLVPFADGFRQELLGVGHPPAGVKHYLVLMGQLNRQLAGDGREVGELTREVAEEFLATRRARGQRRVPTLASLVPLFEYLKKQEALAPEAPKPPTAREMLLARYHDYLVDDRGLMPSTVARYERFARRFLAQGASRTGTDVGSKNLGHQAACRRRTHKAKHRRSRLAVWERGRPGTRETRPVGVPACVARASGA